MSQLYDTAAEPGRSEGIAAAVEAVTGGKLVVMPTDTVYGIGANAFDGEAVGALLAAKHRGRDMPVPVLVGSWRTLDGLVLRMPRFAREAIEAFWPGGLTLIVEHARSLSWDLGDSDGTVAVRMPLHPVALQVLAETGPMAVSSANLSGRPTATTAAGVREELGESVAVYLEAGEVGEPVASTIIDLTGSRPRVVRDGAIGEQDLREVFGDELDYPSA